MLLPVAADAQWAEWRGPARDGVVASALVPAEWPAALTEGWTAEVGEGYSTPVAGEGRVFVHARRDSDETVTAFDLATGKRLWTDTHTAPFTKNQYATSMAKGPNVTPLFAGGRLYWSVPFPHEWNENIVTPLVAGDMIVVSGTRKGTYGLKVARDAGAWKAIEAWHSPETSMYMSSPVLVDGVVYGFSSRRKGHRYATGKSATYTHPLFVPGGVLVRDQMHLRLWKF